MYSGKRLETRMVYISHGTEVAYDYKQICGN